MRFSYEEAEKYGGNGGSKTNFFSLKNDGDKAYVHILGNDMNDFSGYAVHRVPIGDGYRYVNCLREAGAPITDCPFCAEGKHNPEVSKIYAKLFLPLYDCDTDEVKIWERGKSFFRTLASYCSHNPNVSEVITEVERCGKAGDQQTTYNLYATRDTDNFDIENVREDIPNILGDVILDKTRSDMEYYLDRGSFPSDSSNNDSGVTRRGQRERADVPSTEGSERRTPSSNRRRTNSEDDY